MRALITTGKAAEREAHELVVLNQPHTVLINTDRFELNRFNLLEAWFRGNQLCDLDRGVWYSCQLAIKPGIDPHFEVGGRNWLSGRAKLEDAKEGRFTLEFCGYTRNRFQQFHQAHLTPRQRWFELPIVVNEDLLKILENIAQREGISLETTIEHALMTRVHQEKNPNEPSSRSCALENLL